jgi:hypothetical protein
MPRADFCAWWSRQMISRALLCFAAAHVLYAQSIAIGPSTHVSVDEPKSTFAETWIATNPRNANNIIAAVTRLGHNEWRGVTYASFDGGRHWVQSKIPRDTLTIFDGDPVVSFDADGVAYYSVTAAPEGPDGTPYGSTILYRSTDGGRTWKWATRVPTLRDRQYQASDTTNSAFRGRFYIAGTGRMFGKEGKEVHVSSVAFSDDKGASLPGATEISGENGQSGFLNGILIGPHGSVVLIASAGKREPDSSYNAVVVASHSENGGVSFSPETPGPTIKTGFAGVHSTPLHVAIDMSAGPHRGRVYVAGVDFSAGREHAAVTVTHSDDLGKTWSELRTVTNGDSGRNAPIDVSVAVNRDGVVGVTWVDRREDPTADCWREYFSASVDGGESFLPNVTPTRKPTCPNEVANWIPWSTNYHYSKDKKWLEQVTINVIGDRFTNSGDTQGLDADRNGVFHSAWINAETGTMQLWHTAYTVSGGPRVAAANAANAANTDGADSLSLDSVLQLVTSDLDLNFSTRELRTSVRVRNVGATPQRGPFTIVLDSVKSGLQGMRPVNAKCGGSATLGGAGGADGAGASWIVGTGALLKPRGETRPVALRWSFSGTVPPSREEPLRAYFSIRRGNSCR